MDIRIPSKDSIGTGRLVFCTACKTMHHVGSMIVIEYLSDGHTVIERVCSIGCLSDVLREYSL